MTYDFTKEPSEAAEYLKDKGLKLTFNYEEMMHEAHHKAFTVAKVTKLDLLSDIHTSLQDALKEGKPFSQWKDELKPTLKQKGWWGEVEVTKPETPLQPRPSPEVETSAPSLKETKTIYVGSRRLKTIYDTNMRVAYATGRYASQMQSDAEFLYYSAILDTRTRPDHSKLHGTILPKTHPWWNSNYPPNGWRCRCKVRAYTKEELSAKGLTPSNFTPPTIADKDWAYNPGDASYSAEKAYYDKINALSCKSKNAKKREVLCPFLDTARENYKTDMQELLPKKEEWDAFVERALNQDIKNHESMRLGYLSMVSGLEKYLQKAPPQSDLILVDTGSIRNLKAKGEESVAKTKKSGKKNTLTNKDIKELFEVLNAPNAAYIDTHLLLIYSLSSKAKIVISIDTGDKKRIYNTIHSGQLYKEEDLKKLLEDKEKIF